MLSSLVQLVTLGKGLVDHDDRPCEVRYVDLPSLASVPCILEIFLSSPIEEIGDVVPVCEDVHPDVMRTLLIGSSWCILRSLDI
jgi:hypothetical protein